MKVSTLHDAHVAAGRWQIPSVRVGHCIVYQYGFDAMVAEAMRHPAFHLRLAGLADERQAWFQRSGNACRGDLMWLNGDSAPRPDSHEFSNHALEYVVGLVREE